MKSMGVATGCGCKEVYSSGGSRGGSQGAMEPSFQSRLCTDTVARLQLLLAIKFVPACWLLICIH